MPTDLPNRSEPDLTSRSAQAAFLTTAFVTDDPFLVSHALGRLASTRGRERSFRDDPALSVVMATIQSFGLEITVRPRNSVSQT